MADGNHEGALEKEILARSHLSAEASVEFHEFEFALHHIAEAFSRWSSSVHEFVSGEFLPQADVSVLQLIRMNEEPKSATDIGRFLNRDDSSNILYALRKLEKAGLIEKGDSPLRQTTYRVTERGMEVTDHYARVRRDVLLNGLAGLIQEEGELAATIKTMWRICGLYEQGARSISVTRVLQGDRNAKNAVEPAAKRRRSAGLNKTPRVARKTRAAGR